MACGVQKWGHLYKRNFYTVRTSHEFWDTRKQAWRKGTLKTDAERVVIKCMGAQGKPYPYPRAAPGQAWVKDCFFLRIWLQQAAKGAGHCVWERRVCVEPSSKIQMFCILIPEMNLIRSKLAFTYPRANHFCDTFDTAPGICSIFNDVVTPA